MHPERERTRCGRSKSGIQPKMPNTRRERHQDQRHAQKKHAGRPAEDHSHHAWSKNHRAGSGCEDPVNSIRRLRISSPGKPPPAGSRHRFHRGDDRFPPIGESDPAPRCDAPVRPRPHRNACGSRRACPDRSRICPCADEETDNFHPEESRLPSCPRPAKPSRPQEPHLWLDTAYARPIGSGSNPRCRCSSVGAGAFPTRRRSPSPRGSFPRHRSFHRAPCSRLERFFDGLGDFLAVRRLFWFEPRDRFAILADEELAEVPFHITRKHTVLAG